MVHHREGEIGAAHFAAFRVEAGKGLRRGAFVDQVAVNVNERGLPGFFADHVGIPDFLVESFRRHGGFSDFSTRLV